MRGHVQLGRQPGVEQGDAAEAGQPGRELQAPFDEGVDLQGRRAEQPQRAPADQQRLGQRFAARRLGVRAGRRGMALDEQRGGQRRRRGHQAVEEIGVEEGVRCAMAVEREQHRQAGQHQQGIAEGARQRARLAKAQPDQARALERPGAGGAAGVQRKRDHEGEEHGADGQAGFEGGGQARARTHPGGNGDVEARQHERRNGGAVLGVADQAVLQCEGDGRQAEQQAALEPGVGPVCLGFVSRLARRHQHDGCEEQEEGDQEQLAAGVILGAVLEHAPGGADDEGAEKADQVQRAPGAVPGHRGDAQVEHQVVAEQGDMVAAAGRDQQRRSEAAQRANDRQRARVLQHGQRGRQRGHGDHQREHRRHGQHAVEAEGDEQRQVEHRHRAALQHLGVARAAGAKAPAKHEQGHGHGGNAGQPHLDGHLHMLAGVLGQERQTDEQDADTGLDDGVAAEQPGLDRRQGVGARRRRRARWPWRRCG